MATRKMLQTKQIIEEILVGRICNKCGQEEQMELTTFSQIHEFHVSGGFGSYYPSDMETIQFELCGKCLKTIVDQFSIPPTSNDLLSFMIGDQWVFGKLPYVITITKDMTEQEKDKKYSAALSALDDEYDDRYEATLVVNKVIEHHGAKCIILGIVADTKQYVLMEIDTGDCVDPFLSEPL